MAEVENKKKDEKDDARPVDVLQFEDNVDPSYVPEGFESVEDFLKDVREEYQLDLEADEENRKEAISDKKFVAGDQWDAQVLEERQGLPCLVINTIPQFTAQLTGDWRDSRRAIKVVPSEDNDAEIASIRGDLIRAIEMRSRADRVYNSAFESTVQCGDGAFRIAVEYARNDVFDQDIFIRPIEDALSVVWDRMSVDPTGKDARHVFVDDVLPLKEFKRKWGNIDYSELGNKLKQELFSTGWIENDEVRVTEYWRLIERDKLLGLFEDGSTRYLHEDSVEELISRHGNIVKTRLAPCTYAQMHLITGFKILSGPFEYQLDRVPIIRMMGRSVNIEGKRVRYGLVRFMKDLIRLKNFWRSVAAEQLGYAPKAQWIAPESAVEGREEQFRKAHLSRDPLIVYNDNAENAPQRIDPPVPQAALLNEANVNTQDMKDVTGIHDASLGIRSNETSGRAINARQREGDIASLTYYDNGNSSVLEGGSVINQLIGQIYDGTRIMMVVGEDEAVKYVKINDPGDPNSPNLTVGNYDVALSTGASYSTRRVEAAQSMMEAVQVWPNLIAVAGDLIAKAQDWPGADKLAERLAKTIPPELRGEDEESSQVAPVIPPEVVQQLQMELQATKQENEQLKTSREIDIQKLQIDRYNAETQRIRALSDHQVDANQLEVDAIEAILNSSSENSFT